MSSKGRCKNPQKNQQILESAIALFVVQGFHNTSMDQVAVSAGVSKQTVYSHFSNKQELFKHAVQARHSDYDLSDSSLLAVDAPVRDTLLGLANALLSLLQSPDGIRAKRLCLAEAEAHPEVAAMFFKEGPEHITRLLSNYLSQQHDAGILVINEPHYAAVQFLYMVKGETHMRALLNQPQWSESEVSAYLISCVDMFLSTYSS